MAPKSRSRKRPKSTPSQAHQVAQAGREKTEDAQAQIRPVMQFCVFCDAVAQGPDSKRTHVGVFDFFKRPGVIPQFSIAIRWVNGLGRFRQRIQLLTPELSPHGPPIEGDFNLNSRAAGHTLNVTLTNFELRHPGVYWVEVLLDGQREAAFPLPVYVGDGADGG